nr:protein SIEVE ELEMENT OCCLUSION B-like isoform X2 [Ipomoea batatas]
MDVLLDDHVTREVNVEETHEINQEGRMEVDESQLGTNFVDINIEAENEEYGVENFHAVEVEVNQREIDVENDDGNIFEIGDNIDEDGDSDKEDSDGQKSDEEDIKCDKSDEEECDDKKSNEEESDNQNGRMVHRNAMHMVLMRGLDICGGMSDLKVLSKRRMADMQMVSKRKMSIGVEIGDTIYNSFFTKSVNRKGFDNDGFGAWH